MSRTLTRLRGLLGDAILEPSGRGMLLTPRGETLGARVAMALEAVRGVFAPPEPFDVRRAQRTFRIATADSTEVVVLDRWIHQLRREAPGVQLELVPIDADCIEPLARGTLELAIGPRLPVPGLEQFVFKPLLADELVCVLRRHHPATRRRLTLTRWLELDHVMVGSVLPTVSAVQQALHALGRARRVAARVPSMVSALHLVERSDLTCALPAQLVHALGRGVVTFPLPLAVAPLKLHLLWHPRFTTQPFHRWMRESLLAAVARRS